MGFDKDGTITVELSAIEAMFLTGAIAEDIEALKTQASLDAICKLLFLQGIGQKVVDQIIPKDQQQELLADSLIQALKQEEKRKDAKDKTS
jgi:hypothetical protein